jgi:PKD repeat protein
MMKTLKTYILLLCAAMISVVSGSCKKDETPAKADLLYEVVVDGNQVRFTVMTEGVSSYNWDFGDGQTSTEANPTHVYPGKGKYVPTLTAMVSGQSVESSTVLRISKASPVKLDDKSLADWEAVTTNVVPLGAAKGIVKMIKYDYDGNYIYMYGELNSTKANGDIFDFYIDADNDGTTGYSSFAGGGYEVLLEGQLLVGNMDIYYHAGSQTDFGGYTPQSISEATQVGTIVQDGPVVKFEIRLARGKLKGLTGTAARIGIIVTKSDWSATIGTAPDDNTAGFLLDMND